MKIQGRNIGNIYTKDRLFIYKKDYIPLHLNIAKKKKRHFFALKLTACKRDFQETNNKIQAKLHKQISRLNFQFKVDRLQTILVAKNIYIYASQLFISRMPKMRAIPQLVSAPLNPIPIAQQFRRSHPPCKHSRGQHI